MKPRDIGYWEVYNLQKRKTRKFAKRLAHRRQRGRAKMELRACIRDIQQPSQ